MEKQIKALAMALLVGGNYYEDCYEDKEYDDMSTKIANKMRQELSRKVGSVDEDFIEEMEEIIGQRELLVLETAYTLGLSHGCKMSDAKIEMMLENWRSKNEKIATDL